MTDEEMPPEIDFREGVRGLHQTPAGAKVKLPLLRGRILLGRR